MKLLTYDTGNGPRCGVLRSTIGPKENEDPHYRYKPKEQPSLPERGIAKDYTYELKLP